MHIQQHIDQHALAARKGTGIFFIVFGGVTFCFLFFGAPFLILGLCLHGQYHRLCRELDFLRQYPTANFTQIGQALQLLPKTVYKDLNAAVAYKVLVGVSLDNARGVIVYPAPPAQPVDRLVTVSCPYCGANVTISSLRGGQCEYCDSWLTGEEDR